jgi:pimeloyl-ACP methyl ester carboxylesterase
MLISGLGGTAAFWEPVIAALGAGQRIITLDQRGIAASSRGTDSVTIDTLAEDCLAVLDSVGSEHAALVGHSTGGVIAQSMGLMAPDRINGLALTCTWARADRYMHELFRSRLELLRRLPKEYAASMLFIGYPAGWLRDNRQALDAALAAAPLTPSQQDVIAERIAALLAFDRTREIPGLRPPTIVIGAEDDQVGSTGLFAARACRRYSRCQAVDAGLRGPFLSHQQAGRVHGHPQELAHSHRRLTDRRSSCRCSAKVR